MPLIQASAPAQDEADDTLMGGSLFAGRQGGGLFAPVAPRLRQVPGSGPEGGYSAAISVPAIVALRSLIASVEAGSAQYNAVVWSAKIKPPKPPTQMTVAEIYKWIDDTPGQNHAIGRYQFIPSTLKAVMRKVGAPQTARFSPALQDRLADVLLAEAGLPAFLGGQITQAKFMNNLAKIWAGLPMPSGKSYYAGVAGNKAGMSRTRFAREMSRIFPGLT